ncbi:aspartyl protease family protein [Qipengyuania atrilutea]|uniref:Aspartyl protease family protein n=1 Tax=Qipengyuania atrilutea TaxID=2744473 RepID=A0A850H5I2_9SPHN|nr:aspartyl protease family protein [Actirhodobacter atriluteus]NVD45926.1 aspartyl protease family protein [Actirhodobacter atriluteus]
MNRIALLITLAATTFAAPALAEEPLEVLSNGLPIGEVMIEEHGPYRFIVDTGASNTNILPQLRSALPDVGEPVSSQSLEGAGGAAQVEAVKLSSVTVQGRTHTDMLAFLLPPGPVDALEVDGVLGADILSQYVLEIDVPNRTWSLAERPSSAFEARTIAPIPIHIDEAGAPIVTVAIGGWSMSALVDTGARGTVLNWAAARLLGFAPEDPALATAGAAKGATVQSGTLLKSTIVPEVRIGDCSWTNAKVRIGDLPIFQVIGFADTPALILGMDAFADRRFAIDHPRKHILIAHPQMQDAAELAGP